MALALSAEDRRETKTTSNHLNEREEHEMRMAIEASMKDKRRTRSQESGTCLEPSAVSASSRSNVPGSETRKCWPQPCPRRILQGRDQNIIEDFNFEKFKYMSLP